MQRYRQGKSISTVLCTVLLLAAALTWASPAMADAATGDSDFPTRADEVTLERLPASARSSPLPNAGLGGINTRRRGSAATVEAAGEGTLLDYSAFKHWGGASAQPREFNTVVARTKEEWDALWRMTGQDVPEPLLPGLMAIGLFLGERPSEAYTLRISTIRHIAETDALMITYTEYKPRPNQVFGPGETLNRPKTSPWVVYQLPMTQGPIRFFKQTRLR